MNKLLMLMLYALANQQFATAQKPALDATKILVAPKIDGQLNDAAWQNIPIASLEITFLPEYGKIPSKKTEVKVVYDNDAIYIGALMFESDISKIQLQLSERDGMSTADNFTVGFDTYNDDLNGYRFTVSAAGVQSDQRISLNSNGDLSWDAVWESAVYIDTLGWVCEIKIPYSAIRFSTKEIQDWGLQFNRSMNSTGEYILWSPVDPEVSGIINQWGSLVGLKNIEPPLRLSFSPYLTSGFNREPIDFDPIKFDGSKFLNGGMDVKYGINESFTIDMTLIPNFGEVQSDNIVLNLSPFEQQFNERRPFFTEGVEIFNQTFNFLGDNMFYSRRIGGQPFLFWDVYNQLSDHEEVIENPGESSLINATKFSGRTDQNLGIGVFNAIAAEEFATIKNSETGETRKVLTNPFTNYNMIVFEQALKNNSKISITNTNVLRDGVYRDANVTQVLYDITNANRTFNFWGFGNISDVIEKHENENGVITSDPITGYNYIFGLSQFSGKWNFNFSNAITSKNYDHTDLGIQYNYNVMNNFLGFNYTNQEPKKGIFSNYGTWGNVAYNTTVQPFEYQEFVASLGFNGQFKNFWNAGINIFSKPTYYNDIYEARFDGYTFRHAPFAFLNIWVGSDFRKDLSFNWSLNGGESPIPNDAYFGFAQYVNWNISDKFSIAHALNFSKDQSNFGFLDYAYSETDQLIIYFGRRDIKTIDNELSFKFIFSPKMNILARARHYWGNVNYKQFYTLLDNGNLQDASINGYYDLNFNIFNIDLVYAWQFAPGSFLNVIWKNSIFQSDNIGTDTYFNNLSKTFETPQSNGVSLKIIYFLDYLYLVKNKVG